MIHRFKIFQSVYLIIILFTFFEILTGCAGGRNFTRPDHESLHLDKTTYGEIITKYGDPYRRVTTIKNGETINEISYSYAYAVPYTTTLNARTSKFFFVNGTLIGYQYLSSFPEDNVKFDAEKISTIKQGSTSRAQVIALLGNPAGYFTYPLVKEKNTIGLVYTSYESWRIPFTPKPRFITKSLIVTYGSDDIVTFTDFSSSESP